ncbi:MAG: 16S rRNA (guanine(966)-N(2))-methyltransferase RsmD [Pseudomonadota bacterium]
MRTNLYLRIIAGQLGGRSIDAPPKGVKGTRPTLERVRESVFDIIARKLPKARVLDLCAGTGSMGFEALSRGASSATFVESLRQNVQLIQHNAATLAVEDRMLLVAGELPYALGRVKGEFDIIFFDPPYSSDLVERTLPRIAAKGLLARTGVMIIERDRRSTEIQSRDFHVLRRHRIGDAELWFLERTAVRPAKEEARGDNGKDEGQE